MCCLHSAAWWRRQWERSGILAVDRADVMPDGWQFWLQWQRMVPIPTHYSKKALLRNDRQ